ncbi:MAG TPA: hypothetical protein VLL54_13100 [Pyrinomonadaceae bacterium]|nr:hypothetical protein [Pyrinomonadaceae bacterium]
MKTILLLALLCFFIPQGQGVITADSPVTVLSQKYSKDRQAPPPVDTSSGPAAAMIAQNKLFERNKRANTSPGERDPNLDTLDGRSAAMEKAVQESRGLKPVDGYAYSAKIHNGSNKPIEIVFWEYQFKESPTATEVTRRQFLCGVAVKPDKDKELKGFSLSGPLDVVSVEALAKRLEHGEEKALINRVEFADGTIWQRKDWNFAEVRLSYARALATPWGNEMCRGL